MSNVQYMFVMQISYSAPWTNFLFTHSPTAAIDESDMKTEPTRSVSSAESVLEDLPEKSASEDDTTINEESANDETPSLLTEKSKQTDGDHGSVSSLDYSSQFEDSSHAPTDDDFDFPYLVPSKEHEMSFKRITVCCYNMQFTDKFTDN